MRKKAVSTLPIIDGATPREESPGKATVALLHLRSDLRLEEYIKQTVQTTHLVYPMDC
jgi:hypothetical protein